SELIAEPKTSIGQVQGGVVTYSDAMDTVSCDVRYTYRRCGLEQDILLRKQLPDPAQWNLSTENLRVQIWTEMLDCPAAEKQVTCLRSETDPVRRQAMASPDFTDERLQFGSCSIGRGKA